MTSSHKHSTTGKSVVAGDIDARYDALDARVTKLEAAPTAIPPMPAGARWSKNFADGSLAPFRINTYTNDHEADKDAMLGWNPDKTQPRYLTQRFVTDSAHISVHDGYLDLRCTKGADGVWQAAFVGTGMNGDGSPAPYKFQYGTVRMMVRMNAGKAVWPGTWFCYGDSWANKEIDWAESIGGRWTANLHGILDGQKLSIVPPSDTEWHEIGLVRTPTYVAYLLDGVERGRTTVAIPDWLGLLADCKVGLDVPDATTPNPFLHLAWVTVD